LLAVLCVILAFAASINREGGARLLLGFYRNCVRNVVRDDDVHENVAMEQSHASVAVDQCGAAANDSSRKPMNKPAKR
jgi:hypothetical protein